VAARLAMTTAECNGNTTTAVPRRSVSVAPATKLSHSSGSGMTVSGAPPICPDAEYG
jgi:hypothetical protein